MTEHQFERELRYQRACRLVESLAGSGLLSETESRALRRHFKETKKPLTGHLLTCYVPAFQG